MTELRPVRPQVVIVGGGFGGLSAARGLARAQVDITLVDCANHHTFQPLLYQVATAGCRRRRSLHRSVTSCEGSRTFACCSTRRSRSMRRRVVCNWPR